MSWFHYVLLGALVLAAALYVLRIWTARMRESALRDSDEALMGKRLVLRASSANLMGVRSQGVAAVRGNGVLSLTESCLHFVMWVPRRSLTIPLNRVTGVATPKSFMGRSKATPLLAVEFTNQAGEADGAAWVVRDLNDWTEALGRRTES